MTRTVRVNASLDADLLKRIDEFARDRHEDRSTAIRQLADLALREIAKRDALQAYRQGLVTLREFARRLELDTWAAHDLLTSEGIAIAQGSISDTAPSIERLTRTRP